jgi:hypothetical protein
LRILGKDETARSKRPRSDGERFMARFKIMIGSRVNEAVLQHQSLMRKQMKMPVVFQSKSLAFTLNLTFNWNTVCFSAFFF